MSSSSKPRPSALRDLAQLCDDAALPSPTRHEHADALFDSPGTKALLGLLDRARGEGASLEAIGRGISATLAIDALADRRPISALERQRIDEVIARAVARDDVAPVRKALALAARARVRLQAGEAEVALADVDCATSLLDEAGASPSARAFVAARRGYALSMLARSEESLHAHAASAALAHASGDERAHVSALQDEGNILQQLGRVTEARERFEASLERSRAAGDRAGEMRGHAGIAYHHLQGLRFEAARDEYAAALVIGETGIAPRLRALVMGYSAMLHLEHDRIERALALAARAVAESAKLGFRLGEGFFAAVQAAAHAQSGDLEGADDRMRFARGRVPADHAYVHVVRLFEAQIEVERADWLAGAGAGAGAGDAAADAGSAARDAAVASARAVLDDLSRAGPGEERSLVDRLDDARVAARILRARLERPASLPAGEAEVVAVAARAGDAAEVVAVAVRADDDETKALTRRLDTRRLLSLLRARPGKVVAACELAAHVWPDEELDEVAACTRIDALVASMEGARLGDGVQREGDGYALRA